MRMPARSLQSRSTFRAVFGLTNASWLKVHEAIQAHDDEYRDLGDAFAEHAAEALEWATATFEASTETWPSK
jgi:hypothetical protein